MIELEMKFDSFDGEDYGEHTIATQFLSKEPLYRVQCWLYVFVSFWQGNDSAHMVSWIHSLDMYIALSPTLFDRQ